MSETRTILDTRNEQQQITKTTRIEVIETEHGDQLLKDGYGIGGDSEDIYANYVKVLLRNDLSGKSIAIIGGGSLILPRLLRPYNITKCDVFELEPEILAWAKRKHGPFGQRFNFIVGDYKTTLVDLYDLIVFDASDVLDEVLLNNKLNPGGKLVVTGAD
jgi:spermidine synthase